MQRGREKVQVQGNKVDFWKYLNDSKEIGKQWNKQQMGEKQNKL